VIASERRRQVRGVAQQIDIALSELQGEFLQVSYPLFGLDSHDWPELYASSVLLECDQIPVLITAAHAVDAIENETGKAVHVGAKHLVRVPERFKRSTDHENDLLDIAASVIPREITLAADMVALPLSRARDEWVSNTRFACVHGYPCTKNRQRRQIDHAAKAFKRRHRTYAGTLADRQDYQRFGRDPQFQVGLRYRKGRNDKGNRATPPDPRGFSGGGLWVIPDIGAARETYLLAGIAIEYVKINGQVIFATRISHIIDFIRQCVLPTHAR